MATITTDQLFALQTRQNEIGRRLKAGSLNVEDVLDATQGILDGIYPTRPVSALPSWYVSPELQLVRAFQANTERKWGFAEGAFPVLPPDSTKLWLLVVKLPNKGRVKGLQRTFDDRWDLIEAPAGYTKWRSSEFLTDPDHLRLAPGYEHTPGIYWVEFEPGTYQGKSPQAALEQSAGDLVGTEALDAIWQFPDWSLSWFVDDTPAPNLSALQFRWDKTSTDWSRVPYLDRWDGRRRLGLRARWADDDGPSWASPSVREC